MTEGRCDPMFVHSDLDDLGLDPYAFRIYGRLTRRARGKQGTAYESVANMAEACGMSERRVHRALRDLERHGLVERRQRKGEPSVYRLTEMSRWRTPARDADPTPAPRADPPTPAPRADPPLHHVQTPPAPRADEGNPLKAIHYKETPPKAPPAGGDRTRPADAGARASPHRKPPRRTAIVYPARGVVLAYSSTASPGSGQVGSTATQGALMPAPARASPPGPSKQEQVEAIVAAYNENRGTLPAAKKVTSKRDRNVRRVIKELGFDEARSAIAIAAMEVSRDRWWLDNGYGFDNLLAGDKFVQKAETAVARGRPGKDPARDGAERITRMLRERDAKGAHQQ